MTTTPDLADDVLMAALRDALLDDVRVLSVRNEPDPWAGLIAAKIKPTENRTWETDYVGPVLIHSSAYRAPKNAVRRVPEGAYEIPARLLLRGHVLALATIAGCHPCEPGCCTCPWAERTVGVFHWQITGVRALPEPIPAKGKLGLWRPGRDLVTQARRQLREAVELAEPDDGLLMQTPTLWRLTVAGVSS